MNAINIFICRELCRDFFLNYIKKITSSHSHSSHWMARWNKHTHSHQYFHLLELGQIEWPYSTQEMLKCGLRDPWFSPRMGHVPWLEATFKKFRIFFYHGASVGGGGSTQATSILHLINALTSRAVRWMGAQL
jgi:hypothetical protein